MIQSEPSEAGESLVEVLLAVFVLGFVGVAVLGALATGIAGSAQHRRQATALTLASSTAEYVARTGFRASCAAMPTPGPADVTIPSGFSVTISLPTKLNGGACATSDTLQVFTIKVSAQIDGVATAVKSLQVLVGSTT